MQYPCQDYKNSQLYNYLYLLNLPAEGIAELLEIVRKRDKNCQSVTKIVNHLGTFLAFSPFAVYLFFPMAVAEVYSTRFKSELLNTSVFSVRIFRFASEQSQITERSDLLLSLKKVK